MRIVFCLNHFLPQQVGGTEVYVHALAKALQHNAHQVQIVIPNLGQHTAHNYIFDGLPVHMYAEPTAKTKAVYSGKQKPDGLLHFKNFISEFKPDVVHVHEVGGSAGIGLYHYELLHQLEINVITTLHVAGYTCTTGTLLYKETDPCNGIIDVLKCSRCVYHSRRNQLPAPKFAASFASVLYKFGFSKFLTGLPILSVLSVPAQIEARKQRIEAITTFSSYVCTVAKWYQQVLLKNNLEQTKIKYVAPALAGSVQKHHQKPNTEKLRLLYAGRISHEKGLHILFAALRLANLPAISLTIYGNPLHDSYHNSLLELAQGLEVQWMGALPQQELMQCLPTYDVVCLPSIVGEMSPMILQEAIASGLAVLASDAPGNLEQLQAHSHSFICKRNNINDTALQLQTLFFNKKKFTQPTDAMPSIRQFDAVARDYEHLYHTKAY